MKTDRYVFFNFYSILWCYIWMVGSIFSSIQRDTVEFFTNNEVWSSKVLTPFMKHCLYQRYAVSSNIKRQMAHRHLLQLLWPGQVMRLYMFEKFSRAPLWLDERFCIQRFNTSRGNPCTLIKHLTLVYWALEWKLES